MRVLLANEGGASMVEYGVMLALIAVVCLVLIDELGEKVFNAFQSIVTAI